LLDEDREEPSQDPVDEDGWPDPLSRIVQSTFSYRTWSIQSLLDDTGFVEKHPLVKPYRKWLTDAVLHDLNQRKRVPVLLTSRTDVEKADSLAKVARRHPAKQIDPALLTALRQCRNGELHEKDAIWKTWTLHQIANGLRKSSVSMHKNLAILMKENFAARRRQLQEAVEEGQIPIEQRKAKPSFVLAQRILDTGPVTELAQVNKGYRDCNELLADLNHFQENMFRDPIYLKRLHQEGWTEHDCKKELASRVESGLHNLSLKMIRDEELLEHMERNYHHEKALPIVTVEWSDDEQDLLIDGTTTKLNITNDLPLRDEDKKVRVSRKWQKRHGMVENDGEGLATPRHFPGESRRRKRRLQPDGRTLPCAWSKT
jgi:hypothetical protein